jgi:signal transduction histidine kinase
MLHDFLTKERDYIIKKCDDETVKLAGTRPVSSVIRDGWQIFFDQLVDLMSLREITFDAEELNARAATKKVGQRTMDRLAKEDLAVLQPEAKSRGQEYQRLGYTLSDVVHGYGIVCQAITTAATELDYGLSGVEFSQLNLALDVAIAVAVTEYEKFKSVSTQASELERLGFLAHELRNSLTSAFIALELIESGDVGARSQTGKLLNRSLQGMKMLIDSALLAVRMKMDPVPNLEWIRIIDVVSDIEITSAAEARNRVVTFRVEVNPELTVFADRQHFTSALANLTQNAVKFSHEGGNVTIRAIQNGERSNVEVEDECGGLPEAKMKDLFKPYEQMDKNKSGLGL